MSHYNISGTGQEEGLLTSGSTISYWVDSVQPLVFTPLDKDIETETVVVGGGISGLSVAYCLSKAGRKVVVIDDGFVGSGETGRTTAHLVTALDDRYSEIEKVHNENISRLAAESHASAIDFVEKIIREENIDCEFKRTDGYLFLHPSDDVKTLVDEHHATHRAGMLTELINNLIQGIENPWEKMYDPSRITLKVTGDYLKEAGNMAAQYGDYLKSGDLKSLEELPVNQGAVITMGLKKVAVYRDQAKVLHAYSAICPHLGCVLQWNGSESSFDCPCHGSRFTCEGKVVNGPAISDLKKEDLE